MAENTSVNNNDNSSSSEKIRQEILALKKSRRGSLLILAHNYQLDEIQEIADFTGDSLELARYAASYHVPARKEDMVIVLCGVYFMAETAAILNPDSRVIIPDETSGCPLADMITDDKLLELKKQNPGAVVVTYVNSSAGVKALSDICCTSSNAVKVVESIPRDKKIIFVPDRNLGDYVKRRTARHDMIIWDGFCPTHDRLGAGDVMEAKSAHPSAVFMAHPECRREVLDMADFVASTSGMLKIARESPSEEFIVGTESGLLYRLKKENPHKRFYLASPKLVCPNMKKNNLINLHRSLISNSPVVKVPPDIKSKARKAIEAMLAV